MNNNLIEIYKDEEIDCFAFIPLNKDFFYDYLKDSPLLSNINNELNNFFDILNNDSPFIICNTPDCKSILFHRLINPVSDETGKPIVNSNDNYILSLPIVKLLSSYTRSDIYQHTDTILKKTDLNNNQKSFEKKMWTIGYDLKYIKTFINKFFNDDIEFINKNMYGQYVIIPKTSLSFHILSQGTKWKELDNHYIKEFFIKCTNVSPILIASDEENSNQYLFHQFINPIDIHAQTLVNNKILEKSLFKSIANITNTDLSNISTHYKPNKISSDFIYRLNHSYETLNSESDLIWLKNKPKISFDFKKQEYFSFY